MARLRAVGFIGSGLLLALLAACNTALRSPPQIAGAPACALEYLPADWRPPEVLSNGAATTLPAAVAAVAQARALYVGELHAQRDHHANQLEIICLLHRQHGQLAIGVEFLQRPFQAYVDEFVDGRLDERSLRSLTDFDRRWGFDFELYAPILRFARDHGIPVLALNVPTELTRAVARGGLGALSEAERELLPMDLDAVPRGYGHRLLAAFLQASAHRELSFSNFVAAQLLWDEGMAQRVARYLEEHPAGTMVVLAGNGHIAWRAGIPGRVQRLAGVDGAVFVNEGWDFRQHGDAADFVLLPRRGRGELRAL